MMRWAIAILAFAMAGEALAQAPAAPVSPVVSHFRAYRAALDAGDMATAEIEAEAALTASIARDGEGGRTAVLAMNLAQVRLDRGRAREAHEPALRAFNIVSASGAASGLDLLIVRLALGRAELAASGAAGERRLLAALSEAETRTDIDGPIHAAAAALGVWATEATCAIAIIAEPEPQYPPGAQAALSVGAVVTRTIFNEAGESIDTRVAAAVPSRWFADVVNAVAPRWRATRAANSSLDCVMPRVAFSTVMFAFINW